MKQRLNEVYAQVKVNLPEDIRQQIFHDILDELTGFGPIQPLLDDPDVSEVMVNGPKKVFIEKNGKLTKTPITFDDDDHVLRVIDRIILPLGRRVDADSPTVDARLPDGSRVNAVIPPVAIDGPSITIRKFKKYKLSIDQLIEFGSLTVNMGEFIKACVLAHLNIVISGGTGSGKTTLLMSSPVSSRMRSASSRLKMQRSSSFSRIMSCAWRRRLPTLMAGAQSPFATWCGIPCVCGPTGSSWANAGAAKRSICCRP